MTTCTPGSTTSPARRRRSTPRPATGRASTVRTSSVSRRSRSSSTRSTTCSTSDRGVATPARTRARRSSGRPTSSRTTSSSRSSDRSERGRAMTGELLKREVRIDPAIGAIEIKITAQARDEEAVRAALEAADIEAERREIWFFDTPSLDLFDRGLVLRARLVRGGADDSTVKLRPVDASTVAEHWRDTPGFEIELDAVGADTICSAKLSVDQDRGEIAAVAAGKRPIRSLFSKTQERLVEEYWGDDVSWEALSSFGPVAVRKWQFTPKGFQWEVTVEEWVLPDDTDLVEISIKAPPGEAAAASAAFLGQLRKRGFDPDGAQQTKTRSALRYFTT